MRRFPHVKGLTAAGIPPPAWHNTCDLTARTHSDYQVNYVNFKICQTTAAFKVAPLQTNATNHTNVANSAKAAVRIAANFIAREWRLMRGPYDLIAIGCR